MKIRFATKVTAAAAAGLIAAACGGESTPQPATPATAGDGANDEGSTDETLEGMEGTGEDQAACCKGMNECKGKGGCAIAGKHDCQGKNECKGQGGCNMHCPKADG